jgi:hypothetical protein
VALAAFVVWERRLKGDPLVEPKLLANRTYISGLAVLLAYFGAVGGLLLCVSLFVQLAEGFSPIHAGLTLIPMFVGMAGGQALVARLGRHLLQGGVVVLAGVDMDIVGSASGVLEAVQQLSSALGVAVLGTVFFSAFGGGHLPTHALQVTTWACPVPVAIAFALVFLLPMHARAPPPD